MNKKTLLVLVGCLSLSHSALAKTYIYQAISDFPDILAGEVPFYKDTVANRNALAINADNEDHLNKFARATRTFNKEAGTYDVTIATLGENDGESIYRLLINDVIIGIKENARTSNNFAEQQHVFKNVVIPANATISVDASAVSNKLIPVPGGFDYARGRWRSLSLSTAGEVSDNIDLSLTISATANAVSVNDTINYIMTVNNLSANRTATGLSISAALPPELSFVASSNCSLDNSEINCLLPELAPNSPDTASWSAKAIASGTAILNANTSADQADDFSDNNNATVSTLINGDNINKDVAVSIDLTDDILSKGESSRLNIVVTNNGQDDLAAVIVELSANPNLDFSKPFETCIQEAEKLSCTIESLLSHETFTLGSNISSTNTGTFTIEATALIGEDEVSENNTASLMLDVEHDNSTNQESDSGKPSAGSTTALYLLGLLSLLVLRRRAD